MLMKKILVYRAHGAPANIETDEEPIEDTLNLMFKRKGRVIAKFRWAHIHGWEEDLSKNSVPRKVGRPPKAAADKK